MPANNSSGPLKLDCIKKMILRKRRCKPKTEVKIPLATRAWKYARIGLVSATVIVVPLAIPLASSAKLLIKETFDNGISSVWDKELCCDHSAMTVSSPVRYTGEGQSVKFTYRMDDYLRNGTSKRAELKLKEYMPIGSERWYKYSMYIPSTWQNTEEGFIINQFGQRPDDGEDDHVPALFLATDGKVLTLGSRWDPRKLTTSKNSVQGETWELGSVPKGRWVDIIYRVKWSYNSDGILELYMDDKKVVSKKGPNCYNDESGVTLKLGLYASGIRSNTDGYDFTKQVIYYDDLRVGVSRSDLDK